MENSSVNDEITFQEVFSRIKSSFGFLIKRWWVVVIAAVIGGVIGILYASNKPESYTAKLSFILEEGKGVGGGLASLAGQFGVDLGGGIGGNGPLSADNITLFLKSSSLTAETLLTPYDASGKTSLADRYAEIYGLKDQWKESDKVGKVVSFPVNGTSYSRLQDSLLQILIERVSNNDIIISKPDRKASFIEVSTTMRDEMLSKFYCERLVSAALSRYIDIKTNRQSNNINRLQRRADSISALLSRKTYSSAVAQERVLDINPALRSTAAVPTEVISRDKVMLTAIYGEIVKNLEISKVALSQETPVIQVIDDVRLPLRKNITSKRLAAIIGGFLMAALASSILIGMALVSKT